MFILTAQTAALVEILTPLLTEPPMAVELQDHERHPGYCLRNGHCVDARGTTKTPCRLVCMADHGAFSWLSSAEPPRPATGPSLPVASFRLPDGAPQCPLDRGRSPLTPPPKPERTGAAI